MIHRLHTFLTTDSLDRTKALTGAAFTFGSVLVMLAVWGAG